MPGNRRAANLVVCDASRGTGNPVVPGTGQRAARRVPNKAGGPDVAGHAAAAAGDGKGIRVDGHCRTKVRGPDTLAGGGSPIRTQHIHVPLPAASAVAGRAPTRQRCQPIADLDLNCRCAQPIRQPSGACRFGKRLPFR